MEVSRNVVSYSVDVIHDEIFCRKLPASRFDKCVDTFLLITFVKSVFVLFVYCLFVCLYFFLPIFFLSA